MTTASFGSEFKDQWTLVEDFGRHGVEQMKEISQFLKRQFEIEQDYSQKMLKLISTHKTEIKKATEKGTSNFHKGVITSTVAQSWQQILSENEHIAQSHAKFAESLENEIRKSVKNQIKEHEKLIKTSFDEVRRLGAELKRSVDLMERSREKQERATRDMKQSYQDFEKISKNPKSKPEAIEKQKADADKKAVFARESIDQYSKIIEETNAQKNTFFQEQLPGALDKFQSEDETGRIEFLKTTLNTYGLILSNQQEPLQKSVESLQQIFQMISPSYDTDIFIKLVKSGEQQVPEDYVFEEKVTSPTRKKSAQPRLASPTGSMTLTGEASDDTDTITSLPLKQGKKKATERIKQINKDLTVLTQKRQTCDNLLEVKNSAEQSQKTQQSLIEKKMAVESLIEDLEGRRFVLEKYLGVDPSPPSYSSQNSPVVGPGSAAIRAPASPDSPTTYEYNVASNHSSRYSPQEDNNNGYHGNTANEGSNDDYQHGSFNNGGDIGVAVGGESGNGPTIGRAKAVYDFDGTGDSMEISFRADDILEIKEKLDDGWWRCEYLAEGGQWVQGLAPGNYLEEI